MSQFVYLLHASGEYGPDYLTASLTKKGILDEWQCVWPRLAHESDKDSIEARLKVLLEKSPDELVSCEHGHALTDGWGGAVLQVVWLE